MMDLGLKLSQLKISHLNVSLSAKQLKLTFSL